MEPTHPPDTKQLVRADVRRNYRKLIATAQELFEQQGADASMAEVARRAGVGTATVYRHFPTRQSLLEALLTERYEALREQAVRLLDAPSADAALSTWLSAFISHVTVFRGLAASVLVALRDEQSELLSSCHAMREAGAALFVRAQRVGAVRGDIEFRHVLRLTAAIAATAEQSRDEASQLLSIVLRGVAPTATHRS